MVVKMRPIGKTELKKTISRTSLHIMSCELSGFNLQPQLYSSPLYLNQPLWLFFFRGKMDLEIRLTWFKSIRLNHRNLRFICTKDSQKMAISWGSTQYHLFSAQPACYCEDYGWCVLNVLFIPWLSVCAQYTVTNMNCKQQQGHFISSQLNKPYASSLSQEASLVAQLVKNPPWMQETWVKSLGWEDSPGEGKGYPL